MSDFLYASSSFGIAISLIAYEIGLIAKRKFKKSIFNPLLIAILFVISLLVIFQIDYVDYYASAKYIDDLLTPATVSLAVPLYKQIEKLKENAAAIFFSLTAGSLTGMSSVLILSYAFGLDHRLYITLLPKSITSAIGMGISEEWGGIPTITIAAIIMTGILGNALADVVLRLFHIVDPIAKGLSIGASSHAIGTAHAVELGETEGAMSSLAIIVSGMITVMCVPLFSRFL